MPRRDTGKRRREEKHISMVNEGDTREGENTNQRARALATPTLRPRSGRSSSPLFFLLLFLSSCVVVSRGVSPRVASRRVFCGRHSHWSQWQRRERRAPPMTHTHTRTHPTPLHSTSLPHRKRRRLRVRQRDTRRTKRLEKSCARSAAAQRLPIQLHQAERIGSARMSCT